MHLSGAPHKHASKRITPPRRTARPWRNGRRRHIFFPSGCENDSLPLVSSDGVKAECLRGTLSGRGIAPNCYSSSVSLPASICLPLSVHPSVLLALCPPQALCVCSPAQRSLCGDLMPVRAFSLLVLCIALRKCSTPRSAGSSSEDGESGG